jgi:hypothetical protein
MIVSPIANPPIPNRQSPIPTLFVKETVNFELLGLFSFVNKLLKQELLTSLTPDP